MINLGLRISKDMKDKLYEIAEMKRRTLSDYIRIILEDAIKAENEKREGK